jgi:hypothetical protein
MAGTREIACDDKKLSLAGAIPNLMDGSAYKTSVCYKWSAGSVYLWRCSQRGLGRSMP